MDDDVRSVVGALASVDEANYSDLARQFRLSRQWVAELGRRYRDGGVEPRSRRPKGSPSQIPSAVEEAIVRFRKDLESDGLDAGPVSIAWMLEQASLPVPSNSTIWRVLTARGFIVPEPKKRPKTSYLSFEFGLPNACWQMDSTHWQLGGGALVEIIDVLDDYSRACTRSKAVLTTTSEEAENALKEAFAVFGIPARLLTDNGRAFSLRRLGQTNSLQRYVAGLGINAFTARPYHPQTCGKVERFHLSVKKWLGAHRPAETIDELQVLLDEFVTHYNTARRHKARGCPPQLAWDMKQKAEPGPPIVLDEPGRVVSRTVSKDGVIQIASGNRVGIGKQWAGETVIVISMGRRHEILHQNKPIATAVTSPGQPYSRADSC